MTKTKTLLDTLAPKTDRQLIALLRRWVDKCESITQKMEVAGSFFYTEDERNACEHRDVIREELLIRWYNRGLIADWTEGVSGDEACENWFRELFASDDWDLTSWHLGDGWC